MSSAEAEFGQQQAHDEAWRDEVASRLNKYRARRRRSRDEHSMNLDFETETPARETRRADTEFYRRANAALDQPASLDVPLVHADAPVEEQQGEGEWLYEGAPAQSCNEDPGYDPDFDFNKPRVFEAGPEAMAPARPESNLIVFPRALAVEAPKPRKDELAEPVIERPRILDVPEEITPTIQGPLFAHVELEPEEEPETGTRASEFELPLQVAVVPMRAYAALVDMLLVAIACSVFATIVLNTIPGIPHTKATFAGAAATLMVFWSVYNYLFLVYCGRTVGMDMAGLSVVDFEGELPDWTQRRRRAFAMVLSFASVGLGFAWALVDQDTLCWHDRVSGTYVAQKQLLSR